MPTFRRSLLVVFAASLFAVPSLASPPPQAMSLRTMAVTAELVVVVDTASIVDDLGVIKCRVLDVVHGAGITAGEEIVVEKKDHIQVAPATFDRTVLYLTFARRPQERNPHRKPLDPRVEFVSFDEGMVHRDRQGGVHRPGYGFFQLALAKVPELTWDKYLAELRNDAREVDGLHAIMRIDHPPTRNQALFRWIERHRDDMVHLRSLDVDPRNWGPLTHQIFPWIMESNITADCWRAVALAAELKAYNGPNGFSFCTSEGRTLLLDKALDSSLPEATRLAALEWFALHTTQRLSPSPNHQGHPTARDIHSDEQVQYWPRLEPLLSHADKNWRAMAARAVESMGYTLDAWQFGMATPKTVVPKLIERFRIEDDRVVRAELLSAISRIGSDVRTTYYDNPDRLQVVTRLVEARDGKLRLELIARGDPKITSRLKRLPRFECHKYVPDRYDAVESRTVDAAPADPQTNPDDAWRNGSLIVVLPDDFKLLEHWTVTPVGHIGTADTGQVAWKAETLTLPMIRAKNGP